MNNTLEPTDKGVSSSQMMTGEPRKIGIEAQRIFREKKHGMDVVALELIRNLQKLDTYNQYFIFVKPDIDHCLQTTDNFHIVEVKAKTYLDWEQIFLPRAIKKTGVELIHFTSNTAALYCPVPTVITLHDVIFLETRKAKGNLYQKLGHIYRRWNVPRVVRKSKKILTVSNFEKTQIASKLPHIQDKTIVAHNGVASKYHLNLDFHQEKLHEKAEPKNFIFFLGNQAPKKNMQNMLKGYVQYVEKVENSLPLAIASTSEEQLDEWLSRLNISGIRPHIILPGYIPGDKMEYWYNQAKVFVYPSLREGFGLPILEAMACGTPVITANTSSMPEVANGCALLVDPHKAEEITQAIIQLTQDKALEEKLVATGLENVKNFSWEEHARKALHVYKEVLNKKSVK